MVEKEKTRGRNTPLALIGVIFVADSTSSVLLPFLFQGEEVDFFKATKGKTKTRHEFIRLRLPYPAIAGKEIREVSPMVWIVTHTPFTAELLFF